MSNIPPPIEEPGHHELGVTDSENSIENKEVEGLSQGQIVRKRFFRHKGALISMFLLAFIIILAFTSVGVAFGDWKSGGWWPYTWNNAVDIENGGRPTWTLIPFDFGNHPFGQDEVGRDIFAVVMRGTQQSLMIMVIVGLIATVTGTVIGAISGYYRGWTDSVLMRFTDVVITIPVIVIGAVLGRRFGISGAVILAVILGFVLWTGMARLVRGEFLSLREREFVDAARVAGARDRRIIFRHILPNAIAPILVAMTLGIPAAILTEAGLSFLGLGVQPPYATWGNILNDGRDYIEIAWWLTLYPGLAILITVLSYNLMGEGIRDALDPRLRQSRLGRIVRLGR
jgi:ABC-type dipeptide/oligopeptide/nickel transport system permease subunit